MSNKWFWLLIIVLSIGLFVFILRNHRLANKDQLNADGIRDDVAKAIAEKFPESEKKRAAVTQLARAFQLAIDHPDNALEVNRIHEKAHECLDAIEGLGPYDGPTFTGSIIEGFVVNSLERTRSYIHYNAGLSGYVFQDTNAKMASCEFDPSKMRD